MYIYCIVHLKYFVYNSAYKTWIYVSISYFNNNFKFNFYNLGNNYDDVFEIPPSPSSNTNEIIGKVLCSPSTSNWTVEKNDKSQ